MQNKVISFKMGHQLQTKMGLEKWRNKTMRLSSDTENIILGLDKLKLGPDGVEPNSINYVISRLMYAICEFNLSIDLLNQLIKRK